MNPKQLKTVLAAHKKWLQSPEEHVPANLSGVWLSGTDLRGVDLRGANFAEADLRGADLRDADLRFARFGRANLEGANLRDANLSGAIFAYADLRGANFGRANLLSADLYSADLRGANLCGADLSSADLCRTGVARLYTTHEVTIYPDRIMYGGESRTADEWRKNPKCVYVVPEMAEAAAKEIEAILAFAEVLTTGKGPDED